MENKPTRRVFSSKGKLLICFEGRQYQLDEEQIYDHKKPINGDLVEIGAQSLSQENAPKFLWTGLKNGLSFTCWIRCD